MNKDRRKQIEAAGKLIDEAMSLLEDAKSQIEDIKSEEEEYRDNIPENLQQSDRYYTADAACDALDSAVSALDEMLGSDVASYLETAME